MFSEQRELKLRFLLTDIGGSPQRVYEPIYCGLGAPENRLKKLKASLGLNRMSCHHFQRRQFRLLAAPPFSLMHELRSHAPEMQFARA